MPGKKKKFIDKKNAVTFYLGHRSQKDPLIADETAPQHVLIPLDQVPSTSGGGGGRSKENEKGDASKRREEQLEYGIYYDDDYDYLQHLKDSQEVSNIEWDICERISAPQLKPVEKGDSKEIKLKLPSSVFQSEVEEEVGLLNKAAISRGPRPDLDPDVIAALDEDFDFDNPENELEDNFMELATCEGEGSLKPEDVQGLFSDDGEEDDEYSDMEDDEDADSVGSLKGPQYTFADEETKSRFTNYSMSSSVIRRNKQLCLLDDRFEKMFEGYEDTEIGALDLDEIEGHVTAQSDVLLKYAEEYEKDQMEEGNLNEKINKLALKQDESSDDDLTESNDEEVEKEKWDCESILSTYSTTKNRPKLIKETSKRNKINVSSRTGIPEGVFGKGLTKSLLKEMDQEYEELHGGPVAKSVYSELSAMRTKTETPEQRNERKKLLKEFRKERRTERKANTAAFRDEKKRQEKVRLNAKANLQGLKL